MQKVEDVCRVMDAIAPPERKEDYDNVGLLSGRMDGEVTGVYVALDLTGRVIDRAQRLGCQMIVTHHPILFHARKNLREDDPEGALLCRLVRSGIAHFAAHTNFDNAPYGTGDCLARALSMTDVEDGGGGLRIGLLPRVMDGDELVSFLRERLGGAPRLYGAKGPMRRTALGPGAGGFMARDAWRLGADVFITGEAKHHEILEAEEMALPLVDAGHYETEQFAINTFADGLQKGLNALQWNVRIYRDPCKEETHAD